MFCDKCGTPIQADFNVCPKCGRVLRQPTSAFDPGRFERRLHLLGTLWIIAGALFLIPSFAMMTFSHILHFGAMHVGPFGPAFFPPLMFGFGYIFLLLALGGICVGWGLKQHEPWARISAIVLGIIALTKPPIGTALGIFTLWVLLPHDAAQQYEQYSRPR